MFVRNVGVVALSVQLLPLIACSAANWPAGGQEHAGSLVIHSSPGLLSHAHDLLVPWTVLRRPPPGGIELTTTTALFHAHTIALTDRQLRAVSQGGTVTARRSSHLFVIALANGQGPSR